MKHLSARRPLTLRTMAVFGRDVKIKVRFILFRVIFIYVVMVGDNAMPKLTVMFIFQLFGNGYR